MSKPEAEITLPGKGTARELRCRVMQSPMAGVTDQTFRGLVRRWAPEALLFTEMINATSLQLGQGNRKIEELAEEQGPIGVQLLGHRPTAMAEAAKRAEDAGAFLIDINMGCPVRKITKKGGGSWLLRDTNLAAKIVNKVANAVQIPVTVKTRLSGCLDSSEPVSFALQLQEAGAQMLTLHGRTREQRFSGAADWGAIAKVKQALTIPVIANGDVKSAKDAFQCLAFTGADGVMIGRGSMGAPWLVGQIHSALKGKSIPKTPGPRSRVKLAREHLQSLLKAKGDHGLLLARKHMCWICTDFADAPKLRHALVRAETPAEAFALLNQQLILLG